MREMKLSPIGRTEINAGEFAVVLDEHYRAGLKNLDGFSHVAILWWFDGSDSPEARNALVTPVPYRTMKEEMGVFATRSPRRPNPIALTVAQILHIDHASGRILVSYFDADANSPVLDLKPYSPCLDRVENPTVPHWCAHWPQSLEESADFDWDGEFSE